MPLEKRETSPRYPPAAGRRRWPFRNSIPEFDRFIGHEDEHVPDLLRLIFLHRDDDRVSAAGAQIVHEDVEELAQDLRIVVDLQAVDRDDLHEGAAARILADEESDIQQYF